MDRPQKLGAIDRTLDLEFELGLVGGLSKNGDGSLERDLVPAVGDLLDVVDEELPFAVEVSIGIQIRPTIGAR